MLKNKIHFICTPLDKGYQVESFIDGKKILSAHDTRKNALNRIFKQITASTKFEVYSIKPNNKDMEG